MTFLRLLIRNLFYHWRGNFAVFLGIVLGSAVLTGALLVGDSLRGSLKTLTLEQLGWVEEALVPGRFFRAELAKEVSGDRHAPLLMLQGSAALKVAGVAKERVGKVTVLGIDDSFWPTPDDDAFWASEEKEVVLNQTLAKALNAKLGDTVVLRVQSGSNVPGETLLGQRKADKVIESIEVKVRRIVPDEGMARFSLKPTPEPARNAFVPIRLLQRKLDLAGRANAILIAQAKPTVQADLHKQLTLDDWGLRFRSPKDRAEAFFKLLAKNSTSLRLSRIYWQDKTGDEPVNRVPDELAQAAEANGGGLTRDAVIAFYEKNRDYYVLESRRMMLEPFVVKAIEKLAPEREDKPHRWSVTPILIYLADTISDGKNEVPYSIIAGSDAVPRKDNEIDLTDWKGSPLQIKPGSRLTLSYFVPDEKNHLVKKSAAFQVRLIEPIHGVLDDPDFVPEVPGVTDKLDISKWENPPFPYDPRRNTKADVEFSTRYRTTPRAYVGLKKAQELWGNRFGNLTSIRVEGRAESADKFPDALLKHLDPAQGGFVFQPVREQALNASAGTTPFGVLFLSFSVFLIASALLLVGLLVRLNIDRRAAEMGLLLATGWSHWRVRWLLLGEGTLLAVVGGLVGLAGALIYGKLMLKLLAANWPGGDSLNFLSLHVEPLSFVIGYASSLVVTVLTLYWATRVLSKLSPRALLSGETAPAASPSNQSSLWGREFISGCALGAMVLVIVARYVSSQEAKAGCFFGSGALLLIAFLACVWNGLRWSNRIAAPRPSLTRLGLRNAGRHLGRSVLTVALLAAASFLIVAVESFHKGTDEHFLENSGGSGGFAFFAEGSVPVFEDLNQEVGNVTFFPCRVQPGDDASCLNLYKPLKPRVVGVSDAFIRRGGFHFGKLLDPEADEKSNGWLLLNRKKDDAIPALIDANTAQWILKVSVGETIEVNNSKGEAVKLRVVGLLAESIFQSEILISEAHFLELYPEQTGFSFFLIDARTSDPQQLKSIEEQLGKGLEAYNLDVATTASRLQGYLAVENMYLATFQALGGLGLILGAVGLAIVLLRGVWERRAELALLQALGLSAGQLAWLVLVENTFLLVLGLAAGTASALLAVAPHLVGSGAQVLWLRIVSLLVIVLAVGLISAALAVWSTLKTPVLTALRRE